MSPNGRRRFRKMNRRFRQRGPAGVRERARKTTGGMARKMILVQYWGRDPLPLPVKPITARSLVGMTMGSRKRAYRAAVAELEQAEVWRGDVVDRSRLHIGERLRPCPGCMDCDPQGFPSLCDGSGVLPARRS